MTPKLLITRLRRAATVTSAGMSVLLLEAPWLGFTASGEIRPTLINPTSQVGTPTVSPVGGASIEPVLIVSVAQVGAPAVSPAVATTISPTLIASTAQVGAPMTAPAGVVAIVPALVASAAHRALPPPAYRARHSSARLRWWPQVSPYRHRKCGAARIRGRTTPCLTAT
jgi:hypothetical protein